MPRLIVTRLADMTAPRPDQDRSRRCDFCGEVVGIYPGGQALLREYPRIVIECQVCAAADTPPPRLTPDHHAPGA